MPQTPPYLHHSSTFAILTNVGFPFGEVGVPPGWGATQHLKRKI